MKVELKLEALTGGVLQSVFNNFSKFRLKHLRRSPFLIKSQAWWCATFSRKKTLAQVFSFKFSEIFKQNYFAEHACGCLNEMNQKNCSHKICSQENIGDCILFSAVADMCTYNSSKKQLHHRCFSMKIGKF